MRRAGGGWTARVGEEGEHDGFCACGRELQIAGRRVCERAAASEQAMQLKTSRKKGDAGDVEESGRGGCQSD